jgi:hypothetical protein
LMLIVPDLGNCCAFAAPQNMATDKPETKTASTFFMIILPLD